MKGDRLYKKAYLLALDGEDEKAFELLKKAIKYNNPKALYALATWYLHGHVVKKNIPKGIELLKEAAKYNHPDALFDLAVSYEKGLGVDKNLEKAFEYYLKAALRNEKQSFYEVGRCYYYGIGTKKDKKIAEIWLDRAEEFGITE